MKNYKAYYESPIGTIEVGGNEEGITYLDFVDKIEAIEDVPDYLKQCLKELDEYFKGERKEFTVNCVVQGTDFQKKVWKALMEVPYGSTETYKDVAVKTGNDKAVRAVGNANHNNKIAIIIPCHRVVGSNGKLTGYAGGLWRKEWLLEHERKCKGN